MYFFEMYTVPVPLQHLNLNPHPPISSEEERREEPRKRDDDFVRAAVDMASKTQPFAGHKTAPLLGRWPGFHWWRMNPPEIMHGMFGLKHD